MLYSDIKKILGKWPIDSFEKNRIFMHYLKGLVLKNFLIKKKHPYN